MEFCDKCGKVIEDRRTDISVVGDCIYHIDCANEILEIKEEISV